MPDRPDKAPPPPAATGGKPAATGGKPAAKRPDKVAAQAARADRLGQALRDNLRRRKQQTRARDGAPD